MRSFYTIKEAIRGGPCLKLSLADGEYIVEPHLLDRNRKVDTLLRAYQIRGPHGRCRDVRVQALRLGAPPGQGQIVCAASPAPSPCPVAWMTTGLSRRASRGRNNLVAIPT